MKNGENKRKIVKIGFFCPGVLGAHMSAYLTDVGHSIATSLHNSNRRVRISDTGDEFLETPAEADLSELIATLVSENPNEVSTIPSACVNLDLLQALDAHRYGLNIAAPDSG